MVLADGGGFGESVPDSRRSGLMVSRADARYPEGGRLSAVELRIGRRRMDPDANHFRFGVSSDWLMGKLL